MKTNLITIVKTPDRDIVTPPGENKTAMAFVFTGIGILLALFIVVFTLAVSSDGGVLRVGVGGGLFIFVTGVIGAGILLCGSFEADLAAKNRHHVMLANKSVCIGSTWEISGGDDSGYIATLLKGYTKNTEGDLYPILSDVHLTLGKEQLQSILAISREAEVVSILVHTDR